MTKTYKQKTGEYTAHRQRFCSDERKRQNKIKTSAEGEKKVAANRYRVYIKAIKLRNGDILLRERFVLTFRALAPFLVCRYFWMCREHRGKKVVYRATTAARADAAKTKEK